MRSALGAYTPLQAQVGDRIYDRVPTNAVFPYLTLGEAQGVNQSIACLENWEVYAEVHVWSREVGFPEAKSIAANCDKALAERWPTITGFTVRWFETMGQRWMKDPDGLTSHGVLEYRSHYGPED